MDEPPSDSGESPAKTPVAEQIRVQIRRPAVWGLLVLIAVVLALQVWLLYL
jgi:hypothetical protein